MKDFLKSLLMKTGYRFIQNSYFDKLVHVNSIDTDYVYFLFKKRFKNSGSLLFFDIGANIGQTALRMNKFFPDSVIYCFEPVKETYLQLVSNVKDMGNIRAFNLAFGSSIGEVTLQHQKNSEWNSLVPELNENAGSKAGEKETVSLTTIDEFMTGNKIGKIDLLKSDTEGFEVQVLDGAEKTLLAGKVDSIYIEVGFRDNDKQHVHWKALVDKLESYHYSFLGFFDRSLNEDLQLNYANALFIRNL